MAGRQGVEVPLAAARRYCEDVGGLGEMAATIRQSVGGELDVKTGTAILAKYLFGLRLRD